MGDHPYPYGDDEMCQAKPGVRCAAHTYTDLRKAEKSLLSAQNQQREVEVYIASVDTSGMEDTERVAWSQQAEALRVKASNTVASKEVIYEKRDRQFSVGCLSAEKNSRMVLNAVRSGENTLVKRWQDAEDAGDKDTSLRIKKYQADHGDSTLLSDEEREKHTRILERVDAIRSGGHYEVVQREAVLLGQCHKYETERKQYPNLPLTDTTLGQSKNPRLIADTLTRLSSLLKNEGGRDLTTEEKRWLEHVKQFPGKDYLATPAPKATLPKPKQPAERKPAPVLNLPGESPARKELDTDRLKGLIRDPEQLLRKRPQQSVPASTPAPSTSTQPVPAKRTVPALPPRPAVLGGSAPQPSIPTPPPAKTEPPLSPTTPRPLLRSRPQRTGA